MKKITITVGSDLTERKVERLAPENANDLNEIIEYTNSWAGNDLETREIIKDLATYEKRAYEILTECGLPSWNAKIVGKLPDDAVHYYMGLNGRLYTTESPTFYGRNDILCGTDVSGALFWLEYDKLCMIKPVNGKIDLPRDDFHWPEIPREWISNPMPTATLISSFNWLDHSKEDSPTWLASKIRRDGNSVRRFIDEGQQGKAIDLALHVGQMSERLFWKEDHEAAAVKGYARREHERKAQETGAKANRQKRQQKIAAAASEVKKIFNEQAIQAHNDSVIARELRKNGWAESMRTLCGYVAEARKQGLLPEKLEM